MAAQLDSRIKRGTLDDVRALLRREAPVNGIHEQVHVMNLQLLLLFTNLQSVA